jgi:hypothetical protein
MDRDEAERLFSDHFDTIGEMAAAAGRHFSTVEAEAFGAYVTDRLCENDYQRIRAYESRNGASFTTFLSMVINRLLNDYRNRIWGRPRPTEAAKRRGRDAVLLERLLREHHSFEAVFQIMTIDHRIAITRAEFEELAHHINPRVRPRIESAPGADAPDGGQTPEEVAIINQMLERYCRLLQQLRRFCARLATEDALILKFWFEDDRKAGDIEECLGRRRGAMRGASVFRRIRQLTKQLRNSLESAGFSAVEVKAFLAHPGLGDGCDDPAEAESTGAFV